jgi:hypothetical protein
MLEVTRIGLYVYTILTEVEVPDVAVVPIACALQAEVVSVVYVNLVIVGTNSE